MLPRHAEDKNFSDFECTDLSLRIKEEVQKLELHGFDHNAMIAREYLRDIQQNCQISLGPTNIPDYEPSWSPTESPESDTN